MKTKINIKQAYQLKEIELILKRERNKKKIERNKEYFYKNNK